MSNAVALCWLIGMALVLTGLIVPASVFEPFAAGDTSHRLHMAQYPVVRMDNRIWLPILQMHIWVLYLLKAPLFAFKLIPNFYYFAAVVLAGMLAFTHAGKDRAALVFAILFAFCFARQQVVLSLGTKLMQETIGLPMFLMLILGGALELRKNAWLVILAACALMTRDDFWIYLAVVSILNWRKILSDRSYVLSFLALWAVPVAWLLMIPLVYWLLDGRLPEFPTEWPLGINKSGNESVSSLSTAWSSLWLSLRRTGLVYLPPALLAVWLAIEIWISPTRRQPVRRETLNLRFMPFSLVSLGIIYGLTIVFDPYQATYGDWRMSLPLAMHGAVWVVILSAQVSPERRYARFVVMAVLLLLLTPSTKTGEMLLPWRNYAPVQQVQREIETELQQALDPDNALVCIVDERYFIALHRLLPATFYFKRTMVLQERHSRLATCSALLVRTGSHFRLTRGFKAYRSYTIDGIEYTLFWPGRKSPAIRG